MSELPCNLLKKNSKLEIPFDSIAYDCAQEFKNAFGWVEIDLGNALKYETQAIALLEILEVVVCGSVGGFDKGQQVSNPRYSAHKYFSKFYRLLWIWDKYVTIKEQKKYAKFMEETIKILTVKKK